MLGSHIGPSSRRRGKGSLLRVKRSSACSAFPSRTKSFTNLYHEFLASRDMCTHILAEMCGVYKQCKPFQTEGLSFWVYHTNSYSFPTWEAFFSNLPGHFPPPSGWRGSSSCGDCWSPRYIDPLYCPKEHRPHSPRTRPSNTVEARFKCFRSAQTWSDRVGHSCQVKGFLVLVLGSTLNFSQQCELW